MKVLHVTEALGGGVATALEGYIRTARKHTHVIAAYRRPGHDTGDALDSLAEIVRLSPHKPIQLAQVSRLIRQAKPDVIHAHSSFGGVYSRIVPTSVPIIYTPHCFAFERTDVSDRVRHLYRTIESLLGARTTAFVANGPRETGLCKEIAPQKQVFNCPFSPRMLERSIHPTQIRQEAFPLRIVLVGRVCAQKGVEFVIETAALLHDYVTGTSPAIEIKWVGDGPSALVDSLRAVGVQVVGWRTRLEVIAELDNADLYFHAAAWEAGYAVSLLEAGELAVPVLARNISPLETTGLELAASPTEAAKAILELVSYERRTHASAAASELAAQIWDDSKLCDLNEIYNDVANPHRSIPQPKADSDIASAKGTTNSHVALASK
jgi:glycosyltransferase involved in cell wall biosynthesis